MTEIAFQISAERMDYVIYGLEQEVDIWKNTGMLPTSHHIQK